MGQPIAVESKLVDAYCVFSTDRSVTGQDGAGFASIDDAEAGSGFEATLAARLFAADPAIDRVYVASNDVIVRRAADWDAGSMETAAATISEFFRFYR